MKKQAKGVVNSPSKILLRVILIKARTSNTVCCFLAEGMSCHSESGHKAFWRLQSRAGGPRRGFRSLVLSSPSAPYRLAVDLRHHATKSTSPSRARSPRAADREQEQKKPAAAALLSIYKASSCSKALPTRRLSFALLASSLSMIHGRLQNETTPAGKSGKSGKENTGRWRRTRQEGRPREQGLRWQGHPLWAECRARTWLKQWETHRRSTKPKASSLKRHKTNNSLPSKHKA